MQEPRRSRGSHEEETPRRSRRSAPTKQVEAPEYEYEQEYKSGSGSVKYILLGLVLLLVVAVLVLLCVRCSSSGSGDVGSNTVANLASTVILQDSYGKDLGDDIQLTAGSGAPEGAAEAVLLDVAWVGKGTPSYPLILSISDPSFVNGEGLIVFQRRNGQWERQDAYIVSDGSITFLVNELGSFAFVPYNKFSTPTPVPTDAPEATPTPSVSPTPSTSPSPSASPSPSPTATTGGGTYSGYLNIETVTTTQPTLPPTPSSGNGGGGGIAGEEDEGSGSGSTGNTPSDAETGNSGSGTGDSGSTGSGTGTGDSGSTGSGTGSTGSTGSATDGNANEGT